jgi:hypothetical protein
MINYGLLQYPYINLVKSLASKPKDMLVLGAGLMKAEMEMDAENILAIEWSVERLEKIRKRYAGRLEATLRHDISTGLKQVIPKNKFDTAVSFDFIEHLKKDVALKVLLELQTLITKQIILFVPIEPKMNSFVEMMQYKIQERRKKKNLTLGHHLSTWTPEEFEQLGYDVYVNTNYHKERNWGAMVCIKKLK